MCRKVYFCTAFAVHYRASMDGDKLVVHFADKKHKKRETHEQASVYMSSRFALVMRAAVS